MKLTAILVVAWCFVQTGHSASMGGIMKDMRMGEAMSTEEGHNLVNPVLLGKEQDTPNSVARRSKVKNFIKDTVKVGGESVISSLIDYGINNLLGNKEDADARLGQVGRGYYEPDPALDTPDSVARRSKVNPALLGTRKVLGESVIAGGGNSVARRSRGKGFLRDTGKVVGESVVSSLIDYGVNKVLGNKEDADARLGHSRGYYEPDPALGYRNNKGYYPVPAPTYRHNNGYFPDPAPMYRNNKVYYSNPAWAYRHNKGYYPDPASTYRHNKGYFPDPALMYRHNQGYY